MNAKEHRALSLALDSFNNIMVDFNYDLEQIGRHLLIRRKLCEIIGGDISNHLLPGESLNEHGEPLEHYFLGKSSSTNLTTEEKAWIKNNILLEMQKVWSLNEVDDACLRCSKRAIAEVIGEYLTQYRLPFEKEIKPLYFKEHE